jgi:hypothetical protein
MPEDLERRLMAVGEAAVYAKPTCSAVRIGLQWWGTDYRRAQSQAYWIKRILPAIKPNTSYFFDDLRFQNEALLVRSLGGKIILIQGRSEDDENSGHASEQQTIKADYIVHNSGSRKDLFSGLVRLLTPIDEVEEPSTRSPIQFR